MIFVFPGYILVLSRYHYVYGLDLSLWCIIFLVYYIHGVLYSCTSTTIFHVIFPWLFLITGANDEPCH